MAELKGKNVVVVGGTSGIGFSIAELAANAGANVWALGRSQQYIDEATQKIGDKVKFLSGDVHDGPGLSSIFEQVGKIDHLVGNATGANRTIAPFMQQTAEQFAEAFGKFWGYTTLLRSGVPFMSETGSITLVSGVLARKCRPGMSSLSCVGNAVEGLCRALAVEIAPIRINTVAPGIIDTTMYSGMGEAKDKQLKAMTAEQPIKRPGQPDEVAGAVVYLMTADFVTGINIDVDGGQLLP